MCKSRISSLRFIYMVKNLLSVWSHFQLPRFSSTKSCILAWLEVVARDQPNATISVVDFSLPPPVILVTENGEIIALSKSQFLRNSRLVHVHSASIMQNRPAIRRIESRGVCYTLAPLSSIAVVKPHCPRRWPTRAATSLRAIRVIACRSQLYSHITSCIAARRPLIFSLRGWRNPSHGTPH